jgi:hypothetical protein
MQFSLQQMVKAALNDSRGQGRIKLAQAAEEENKSTCTCEECGKTCSEDSKLCRECAQKNSTTEMATTDQENEKTSSLRILKLAAAIDTINNNLHNLDFTGYVKRAEFGPGTGPNALEVTQSEVPGRQSDVVGEAKTKKPQMRTQLTTGSIESAAPTALQVNDEPPKAPYPEQGVLKAGSNIRAIYQKIMKKAAENGGATVSSSKSDALPEEKPVQLDRPAEVRSQERLINSNEAAIDATKEETKAVPKKQMGEVLTEPALSASTDKVLDEALGADKVNQAGAKIAAARVLLRKIAEKGCTCEEEGKEKGTCDFCKLEKASGCGGKKK